jgi:hypothetical protein
MKLRAQSVPDRRRDRRQFLRELVDGVAQAVAEPRPRKQRLQTLDGAVETVGQDAPDPI